MTTATPPAGWYDDPDVADHLRWWDGTSWTERRVAHPRAPSAAVRPAGLARSTETPPRAAAPSPLAGLGAASEVLASPSERLAAVALDVALSIGVLLAAPALGLALAALVDRPAGVPVGLLTLAASAVLAFAQIAGVGRLGQSYGKHLVGIAVVSAVTRRPIGSPAAFGRGIVQTIGVYLFGLGVVWMLWDPRRQGWHDKAVASIVVRTGSRRRLDPVGYLRAIVAAR